MRRLSLALFVLALAVAAAPTAAYAQQSLTFSVGGFSPRAEDGRTDGDVLVSNLDFLAFNVKDFHGGTIGAEYLVGIGDFLEGELGLGLYKRTVPSVYADLVNVNGAEIEQDLKLRNVPFTATIRFLPMGRGNGIEPYIGAGVGINRWRYSESGEFVDYTDGSIFRESYVGTGTATGPIVLGGVRFPFGAWAIGGEIKWQDAKGDLPADQGFSGTKIDLGGWNYLATFAVRF